MPYFKAALGFTGPGLPDLLLCVAPPAGLFDNAAQWLRSGPMLPPQKSAY
jgi:hypothetical protein